MIRSMTGYGRAHNVIGEYEVQVEIRSVNHRYFEYTTKISRAYLYLDEKLKPLVQQHTQRGKVELSVSIFNINGKETQVTVNHNVVESYLSAMRKAGEQFGLEDNLTLTEIFKMTDAFNVFKADVNEEEIWTAVCPVAEEALRKFVAMREVEGQKMKADLQERLAFIAQYLTEVERLAPESITAYRIKLHERMREVLESKQIDEQRILLEAAIFSEKSAIDEETVRLRSHLAQFTDMLNSETTIGRKLDFLVQEINREVNTIGAKAQDIRITKLVVEMKSEVEKIREQIQNIE